MDFHSLYERYAQDVFRFALYLSGDRALADDIAAETFVRVWTAAGEIRQTTVKAYLLTIARNLYMDEVRKRARQVALDDAAVEAMPALAAGPHAFAESRHELARVLHALGQLPELDRSALLMRAQEEMKYEEIAQALALPLATVKVKIHRARLRLAQMLQTKEQSA